MLGVSNNAIANSYKYNSSDIIRYALTSHGITYLLRDKRGTLNRWKHEPAKANKIKDGRGSVAKVRWGNTDCSGLAGAAFRYKKFYKPTDKKKHVLGTIHFADFSRRKKNGFYRVGKKSAIKNNVRHGDAINYTSSPYGHIFFFNGKMSNGKMRTVEAKGRKYGVGSMVRSFNSLKKRPWHIVRSKYVKNNVSNINKFYSVSSASARRTTIGMDDADGTAVDNINISTANMGTYVIKSGDTGTGIAKALGIKFTLLDAANPNVNWGRLRLGQKINIPTEQEIAQTQTQVQIKKVKKVYKVKSGDRGDKIARKLDISLAALKRHNPSVRWNRLQVGQKLNYYVNVEVPMEEQEAPQQEQQSIVAETQQPAPTEQEAQAETQQEPEVTAPQIEEAQTEPAPAPAVEEQAEPVAESTQEPVEQTQESDVETFSSFPYKVRSGDRGDKIAKKFGISLAQLKGANPGVNWRRIKIGQMINIPSDQQFILHTVKRGESLSVIAKKHGVNYVDIKKLNGLKKRSILRVGQTLRVPMAN